MKWFSGNTDPSSKFKTFGGKAGIGGMAIDTYMNLRAGDDLGTAVFKGIATSMAWQTAPMLMSALTFAPAIVNGAVAYRQWHNRASQAYHNNYYTGTVGGGYQDTQRALTMRQAAVQAIQGSKLNARSALGGEAQLLNQNSHFV